jgi:hypothetical protein
MILTYISVLIKAMLYLQVPLMAGVSGMDQVFFRISALDDAANQKKVIHMFF